ncbi:MAG TPA: hypothetical protein VGO89_05555 [Streptomyces sp.]|jgi:hypothetical protein|nr:hypothetical protein [Streptomyces sp.]
MIMVTTFSLKEQSGLEPVGHSFRQLVVPWMSITLAPDPLHQ